MRAGSCKSFDHTRWIELESLGAPPFSRQTDISLPWINVWVVNFSAVSIPDLELYSNV